ncbi:MAG: cytochrome c3 family protein [Acidobacteriaceae bacterium]
MIGAVRTISLLVLSALWAQPPMQVAAQPATTASQSAPQPQSAAQTQSPATQTVEAAPLRGPVQPVPFSHKQHAGTLQLPCEFCHAPVRRGETVAIPQAAQCMQCHQTMDTENPGVQKLASYAKDNATIPWVRVYELPSFVSFSHKTHMQRGATCQECHGPVAKRIQLYKESDISMAGCVNCHRAKKASVECDTCHRIDQ